MANPDLPFGALRKDEPGAYLRKRKESLAKCRTNEKAEKAKVRRRDGGVCRFPGCKEKRWLEVAHLHHKGAGGNPDGSRNVASNMILMCQIHHRGSFSMHSGDIKVKPRTSAGTDGPCEFLVLPLSSPKYTLLARELAVGVLEVFRTPKQSSEGAAL